ncbi:MAG: hypothetical protein J6S33_01610 [Aeriscardovia sp.]|nr:hypothetical protein [Aeriscardovia sp.]
MTVTFTIIAGVTSLERRPKVMAFNNLAWGVSALVGPVLSGVVVSTLLALGVLRQRASGRRLLRHRRVQLP